MAPASIQLQDDQKFALMKFRRNVRDVLQPDHDDQFLLRWLRARNWNSEQAEKMLRDSMIWRQKWEVDTGLKQWNIPELLITHLPSGVAGLEPEGTPVIIVPFSGFDIWGLLHSVTKNDIVKVVILKLEEFLNVAKQSGTHQVTVIFDMDNFNLRQYAWKPATELVISLIQMYEANYPEILKICYIVNAPSIFSLAFNIVKKFMGEYTINKIQIYKADPKKWQAVLREKIPVDFLPKHFGGDAMDPDGNPRCVTKIKQGGKVPKDCYNKNQKEDKIDYTNETVKKGKQLCLDFIVAEEGCVLKWDFRTEDHDIKFGIIYRNSEGVENHVISLHKVNSHMVSEVGAVNCEYPATYTVIFDNTSSMLRSKKVSYDIQLSAPLDKLDLSILPDEDEDTKL